MATRKPVECTLFDRTGSGVGLGTPADELSERERAQAGVPVVGVVVGLVANFQRPKKSSPNSTSQPLPAPSDEGE